ncbi:hypothetical protein DAPPUDRAFT_336813 [Daphnia pulex]|uniref:Uncharacterized protein n=2 Tax=Daphnia pulex TaxID=6669 RepID=E9I0E9_DAPPU|nr:hypothetical protein DAPPUDRAFT_336813 [Daphnia pulex]|eukprot:EFX62531.1 hypothetical protein DAPPUDRAFT_336813 [Daphnia pulex]
MANANQQEGENISKDVSHIPKFNRKNYPSWKYGVWLLFRQHGLTEIVENNATKPTEVKDREGVVTNGAAIAAWNRKDILATMIIIVLICYCTKDSISHTLNENEFVSRGKIEQAKDLKKLEEAEGSVLHVRGQKRDGVLNRSNYYHTSESGTSDIMHILPEDVYELCPFRVYTRKKKITLETLNARRLKKFSVLSRKREYAYSA